MSPCFARSPGRGLAAAAYAACLFLLFTGPFAALAQSPYDNDQTKFIRARSFNLPFTLPSADRDRVQSLKLFVAAPGSRDWQLHATATPNQTRPVGGSLQGGFDVRLDRDGPYDFAIMTVYTNGSSIPPSADQLRAEQRVVVDTQPPDVRFQAAQPRPRVDGNIIVGINWEITDPYLDLNSIRLEGRWAGGLPGWGDLSERLGIGAKGQKEWTLRSNQRMEVHLSAMDRAGNRTDKYLVLGAGVGQTTGSSLEPGGVPGNANAYGQPGFKIVNDRTIKLQFKIGERPKSGIGSLELWSTRSGNDWRKVEQQFPAPAEGKDDAEISYTVSQDGTYGFTLVARSNANVSQPPPSGNQPPQIWVVVDTKLPEATLTSIKFAQANDPRTLILTWKATDEHLEAMPVIFEYAPVDKSGAVGKWRQLTEPLSNTGRHVCATPQLPDDAYQFKVRMNVFDRAGNVTEVIYKDPISTDIAPPRVEIFDVKPTKPNKPDGGIQP